MKETVATVVEAVKHVREIEILFVSNTKPFRGRQHMALEFFSQDESWLPFLDSKILTPGIKYFPVTFTRNQPSPGE
ncbi:uncharacterized protein METZ01_LOCUS73123 [marine metagenome]|uniref:Uncharacterized protein n=1 Tax=marine metagenome TaxID=408172 RepID=A0A381TWN6_9ZZZZ